MVPEERSEEAAISASELVEPSGPDDTPEAAESAEGVQPAPTSFNWADASEEATAPTAEAADPSGFVEEAATGDNPEPLSEEAAFGASADSPEEEAPFDALELLQPIVPKEEEDIPIEDILEELARPDEEVLDPALGQEPSAEDHPETEHLASEIETSNSAAVNTETIEESLAALDLEPKVEEEADFGTEEPVAEVAETPVEASVEASVPVTTKEEASSSTTPFAPVFVQHFDNFVDDEEVPPPPTSPFLAEEGAAAGAPTTGFVRRGAIKQAKPNKPRN